MDVFKNLLDWLAATPTGTLYYRDGLMHRHENGRAALSKRIPKGMRNESREIDEMLILLLMSNPGMELQRLSKNPLLCWIIYMKSHRNIELPKETGMFIENGIIYSKDDKGKIRALASINP